MMGAWAGSGDCMVIEPNEEEDRCWDVDVGVDPVRISQEARVFEDLGLEGRL